MDKIKVETKCEKRICQGDILKDIEFIEYVMVEDGVIEISKIIFPNVIVLTQDCDLNQDYANRKNLESKNKDKFLLSVIVAPIYNAEHLLAGTHLKDLGLDMLQIDKGTKTNLLKNNEIPRYHYIELQEDVHLIPSVIDFKHYFTVNVNYLFEIKVTNFVCKVSELYRERISQRFANFLSRIGLPAPEDS